MQLPNSLEEFPLYKQVGWDKTQLGDYRFFLLTIAFTTLVFVVEFYLDRRQLALFRSSKQVPKELEKVVSTDTFKKSLSYGSDKFLFGLIEGSITFIEGVSLLLLGYLPYAWDTAETLCFRFNLTSHSNSLLFQEIVITSVFVFLLTLHDTVFSLPFSLYKTFVVEEKHGFNKSTYALFFRDKLLMIALTVGLGSPVIGMVVWLVRSMGPYFYFYVWLFLCIVSVIMMTIYPTLIAPLFNKYTKLDQGPVYEAIEALAKRVNFPLTQIFVVDGSKRSQHSNAYFYGFLKSKRIVLFDTLLKQVSRRIASPAQNYFPTTTSTITTATTTSTTSTTSTVLLLLLLVLLLLLLLLLFTA
jgi:STE24 endopeptidase